MDTENAQARVGKLHMLSELRFKLDQSYLLLQAGPVGNALAVWVYTLWSPDVWFEEGNCQGR